MKRERPGGAFLVSLALHLLFGAALLWVLSIPAPLRQWLTSQKVAAPAGERVNFFRVPGGSQPAAVHAGGNGRPRAVGGAPLAPTALVAPTSVPTNALVLKPGAAAVVEAGTGPIVSAGGAGPGIMPMLHDPRIWLPPGMVVVTPLTDSSRFDSAFHEALGHLQDSLAHGVASRAVAGIFSAGGKKYGLDSANIYIADYKIPAALLALLPIRPTGSASQELTVAGRQIAEVNYQAARALDAEDFHAAVKRIRQRKEREKRAHEAALGKTTTASAPAPPPEPLRKPPQKDPIALQTP